MILLDYTHEQNKSVSNGQPNIKTKPLLFRQWFTDFK
jgi:hypothetical protein